MGDHEGTFKIENDDITLKTKPSLTLFGGTFGKLRFDEKTFFNTSLGCTPFWDYKPTNALHSDSSGAYTCDKILKLSTTDKARIKYDVIDGPVGKGIGGPLLFSFFSMNQVVIKYVVNLKQCIMKK